MNLTHVTQVKISFTSVTPADFALDSSVVVSDNDADGCEDSAAEDDDDDNDGIPDITDLFPFNSSESTDFDGDGTGDNADPDDDNDGVLDGDDDCKTSRESFTSITPADFLLDSLVAVSDNDADGCEDSENEDDDDDNDEILDTADSFPFNACASVDTDSDGVPNALHDPLVVPECTPGEHAKLKVDNCPDTLNMNQANNDQATDPSDPNNPSYGGDACDNDDDNDGTLDITDIFPFNSSESTDFDGDGTGDNADPDDDNDGVLDGDDDCKTSRESFTSIAPADFAKDPLLVVSDNDADGCEDSEAEDDDDDNDGKIDTADAFQLNACASVDTDGDGIPNALHDPLTITQCTPEELVKLSIDNCPDTLNMNQANNDQATDPSDPNNPSYGGDACDNDDDNDGTLDITDIFPFNSSESTDFDGDGTGDNADPDDDNDRVLDGNDDCKTSQESFTSITPADFLLDPLVAVTDNDADGCEDSEAEDDDDDNDKVLDTADDLSLNACASVDTDSDGVPNALHDPNVIMQCTAEELAKLRIDNCLNVPNGAAQMEITGVGNQLDRDSDTIGDACDPDDDNDLVCDYSEYKQGDGSCVYNESATTLLDQCPQGNIGWVSSDTTDMNENGCEDGTTEDEDRDDDGIVDGTDSCTDSIDWISITTEDSDQDGCRDSDQDADDDNDGICDFHEYVSAPDTCTIPPMDDSDHQTQLDNCPKVKNGLREIDDVGVGDQTNTDRADELRNGEQLLGDACDVDDDNDGLIEIYSLLMLHNMRHSLNGESYNGATRGCISTGCNGYELISDLDFDSDNDGSTFSGICDIIEGESTPRVNFNDCNIDTDDENSDLFSIFRSLAAHRQCF